MFHFVLSPARPIRVLLAQRPGARDVNLYLTRALSVGDSPRFDLAPREPDSLSSDDLQSAGIVILNDVAVTAATAERLGRFVQRGGGLLFVAGQRGAWPQEHAAMLPVVVSDAVDRSRGQPARLVALEYGHAIFDPFRAPRSGDFSTARFYGYRAATRAPDARPRAVRRRGSGVGEKKMGAGRVLVWMSSLDLVWNDLAVKPVFLPFVHQMARHLGAYREAAPWLTVGDVLDPATAENTTKPSADRAIVSPSGSGWRSTAKVPTLSNSPNRVFTKFADWPLEPCHRR